LARHLRIAFLDLFSISRREKPWRQRRCRNNLDADRRPSHANRRKALRTLILREELNTLAATWSLPQKILQLTENLVTLAA
jgi:hypothetical protein